MIVDCCGFIRFISSDKTRAMVVNITCKLLLVFGSISCTLVQSSNAESSSPSVASESSLTTRQMPSTTSLSVVTSSYQQLLTTSLKLSTSSQQQLIAPPNITDYVECPIVEQLVPHKGPQSGNTVITIYGSGLEKIESLTLCNITCKECSFSRQSKQSITLTTPPWDEPVTVSVKIYATDECNNITTVTFKYMPNPVVSFPHSMQTILQGGIMQIVPGSNLDAVETPVFSVVVRHNSSLAKVQPSPTDCRVVNSSQIVCLTPNLENSVLSELNNNSTPPFGKLINDLSFTFDIIVTYHNFTQSQQANLSVYQHPDLKRLIPMQPFIANEHRTLEIYGTSLTNHGFVLGDITVTVGNGLCSDVLLNDTAITCQPPPVNKDVIRYPPSTGINPAQPNITVIIGEFKFSANQIKYTIKESFNIIMIVMIAILAFIIAVSLMFGILTISKCGKPGRSLVNSGAMPYEQMHDATEESRDIDKEYMKRNVSGHMNESGIECRSMRYKSDSTTGQGVSNEGYVSPSGKANNDHEYETLTL